MNKSVRNIFLLLIAAAIIVRVFVFFTLPEGAYSDALFHLQVIKNSVNQGFLQPTDIFTTPLYYAFGFLLFSLFKFPFATRVVRSRERTAAIATFVDVFPTLPVMPIIPGRYRHIVTRASCFRMY